MRTLADSNKDFQPRRLVAFAFGLAALLILASCGRGGVSSPQGDRAAAQRAAATESRQQPGQAPAQGRTAPAATLLSSEDVGRAYRFILESYVDQVDHAGLIDAARAGVRRTVAESAALPVDVIALDVAPFATGNPDRDWSTFGSILDGAVQRHPDWSIQARPDYQALKTMLESLQDGHSVFIPSDEARRRAETNYFGIGIRLARPDQKAAPVVAEVFPSSPAAIAGLRVGDRILSVGERSVSQLPLSDIADLIRGPQGTEVLLLLERTAAGGSITVRAFRRSIDVPVADGQILDSRLGYIKIRSFTDTTAERVGRLLLEQSQSGVQGFIIDLRGNPGGNLQAVARVAGYFMDPRPIGISVDRAGQREALFAEQRPFRLRAPLPLVVLIDGDSGSGSEILAASLKEYQLGTLVGQKTAGSVGIANTRQLSDGSTVQVTVRRLLSASGAELDRVGVEPDEPVVLGAQDLESGRDPQRDVAITVLRQKIARS